MFIFFVQSLFTLSISRKHVLKINTHTHTHKHARMYISVSPKPMHLYTVIKYDFFSSYSYIISAFFTRTSLAILSGVMIYLTSYLPFVIIVAMRADLQVWHNIIFVSKKYHFEHWFMVTSQYIGDEVGLCTLPYK